MKQMMPSLFQSFVDKKNRIHEWNVTTDDSVSHSVTPQKPGPIAPQVSHNAW